MLGLLAAAPLGKPPPAGPIAASLRVARPAGKMRRRRATERDRAAKPLRDVLDQRLGRKFLDEARRDRDCHWPWMRRLPAKLSQTFRRARVMPT